MSLKIHDFALTPTPFPRGEGQIPEVRALKSPLLHEETGIKGMRAVHSLNMQLPWSSKTVNTDFSLIVVRELTGFHRCSAWHLQEVIIIYLDIN